jgi:hypothetical protein
MCHIIHKLEGFETIGRSTIFVSLVALFVGCSKPTSPTESGTSQSASLLSTPSEYPALIVDQEHQIQGRNTPPSCQIAAAKGIRLDATQFHFSYGTNTIKPNMAQLLFFNSRVYELSSLTETNLYVIDRATLKAVKGGSFAGFHSGDRGMLAIGRTTSRTPEKEDFWVSWVGNFEMK